MRERPTVTIDVHDIDHFVRELSERGVKRVYRAVDKERHSRNYENTTYTAYDPERNVFVRAHIVFPELVALERFELGDRYGHGWHFGHDAKCNPTSKRRFAKALKLLGVNKEIIKQYNSASVEQLARMTDDSELEDGGADITTIYRKGGEVSRTLECDFMGCIKTVRATIEIKHGSMSYHIVIPKWDEIFASLCDQHEKPLKDFEVVRGTIQVQ